MTIIALDRLAPHLPFLRRYARALTRDQAEGDALARAAAARVLDGEAVPEGGGARLAMFAALHDELRARAHPLTTAIDTQLLLLTALEGLSVADAASLTGLSEAEAASRCEAARRELHGSLRARVLIIEDDPIIALDIAELLRSAGHEVIGVAVSEGQAVRLAEEQRPDLVLADINLGVGGDGAAAAGRILERAPCPIVFVTAFPERALTGETREPVYVITKPFDPLMLAVTTFRAVGGTARLEGALAH